MKTKLKIYLAGPDVFREGYGRTLFTKRITFCKKMGLDVVVPFEEDNIVLPTEKALQRKQIAENNEEKVAVADIIVANLNPFRGAEPDSGTVWECAKGEANGKIVFGYTKHYSQALKEFISSYADLFKFTEYPLIEDFDSPVNLMIYEGILRSGGSIGKTFENCIYLIVKREAEIRKKLNK